MLSLLKSSTETANKIKRTIYTLNGLEVVIASQSLIQEGSAFEYTSSTHALSSFCALIWGIIAHD